MIELINFLLERIAEDEKEAREGAAWEMAEWWPTRVARVLAECDAKRRIVETRSRLVAAMAVTDPLGMGDDAQLYTLDWVLDLLALPYADHPDYDERWRP